MFLGVDNPEAQLNLSKFVKLAHSKGIFVHGGYGAMYLNGMNKTDIYQAIRWSQNYINQVKTYNNKHADPAEKLDGVQSDIEIFPSPDNWNEKGFTEIAEAYRTIFGSISKKGLFFSAALPEYLRYSRGVELRNMTAELDAVVPMIYIMDASGYTDLTPSFYSFGWVGEAVTDFLDKIHEDSIFITGLSAYDRQFTFNPRFDTGGMMANSMSLSMTPGSGLEHRDDSNAVQDEPFYTTGRNYSIPYLLARPSEFEPRNFIPDYTRSGVWVYRFTELNNTNYTDVQLTTPAGLFAYINISDETASIHPKKDQYFGSAIFSFLQVFEPSSSRKDVLRGIEPPKIKLNYGFPCLPSVILTNEGPGDLSVSKLLLSKNVELVSAVPSLPMIMPEGDNFTVYYKVNDEANGLISFVTSGGPIGAIVASSRLCVALFSQQAEDLHITDSAGRYTGLNSASGAVVLGLPGVYSGPDSEPEYVVVPNPIIGRYTLKLTGNSRTPANYSLSITMVVNETTIYQKNVTNTTTSAFGEPQILQISTG